MFLIWSKTFRGQKFRYYRKKDTSPNEVFAQSHENSCSLWEEQLITFDTIRNCEFLSDDILFD